MSIKIKELLSRPRTFTVPNKDKDKPPETLRVDARSTFTLEEHQITNEILKNIKSKKLVVVEGTLPGESTSLNVASSSTSVKAATDESNADEVPKTTAKKKVKG